DAVGMLWGGHGARTLARRFSAERPRSRPRVAGSRSVRRRPARGLLRFEASLGVEAAGDGGARGARLAALLRRRERSADQLREFAAGALEVLGSRARLVADDDEITVGGDAVTSPLHEPQPHGLGQGALLDAEAQLDLRGDLVDVLASRSTGADRVPAQLVPGHVQVRRDGEELGHGASLARSGGASTLVVANPTS